MKRLTKDERTGATAIALVALVVCLGSMFLSRRNRVEPAPEELVKTIILATDSVSQNKSSTEDSGNSSKGKRKGKQVKGKNKDKTPAKKKGKKGAKEKKAPSAPSRDFLNDPV